MLAGFTFGVAMFGFAGSASAVHALAGRTYVSELIPKTSDRVLIKTDPILKPKNANAKSGVAVLECNGVVARVNPRFNFTHRATSPFVDFFRSTPGNTGNGIFDVFGQTAFSSITFPLKANVTQGLVPGCAKAPGVPVKFRLASKKVRVNLAQQLSQGVHTGAALSASCPGSSLLGAAVQISGRLSPDTGGSPVNVAATNSRGGAAAATVLTAADGSFSYAFTPSPTNGAAYSETVAFSFAGGAGRDPATAACSWPVFSPPIID